MNNYFVYKYSVHVRVNRYSFNILHIFTTIKEFRHSISWNACIAILYNYMNLLDNNAYLCWSAVCA